MEDEIPTVSLPLSIPQINIIEASPLPDKSVTRSTVGLEENCNTGQTSIGKNPVDTAVSPALSVLSQVEDFTDNTDAPLTVTVGSNTDEEFKLAPECIGETYTVPTQILNETRLPVPSEEPEDNLLLGTGRWTPEGLLGIWYRFSVAVTSSKYLLIIQLLLLAYPITVGFTACRYINDCPMSDAIPVIMFMLAVDSIILIVSRMMQMIQKILDPTGDSHILKGCVTFACLYFLVLLSAELLVFFQKDPSFQPGHLNYCHPNFYKLTYWSNHVSLFCICVASFLHVPSLCFMTPSQEV